MQKKLPGKLRTDLEIRLYLGINFLHSHTCMMYELFCIDLYLVGQYGAVSTLDLNADGTRLLCGYAKGLVCTVYAV